MMRSNDQQTAEKTENLLFWLPESTPIADVVAPLSRLVTVEDFVNPTMTVSDPALTRLHRELDAYEQGLDALENNVSNSFWKNLLWKTRRLPMIFILMTLLMSISAPVFGMTGLYMFFIALLVYLPATWLHMSKTELVFGSIERDCRELEQNLNVISSELQKHNINKIALSPMIEIIQENLHLASPFKPGVILPFSPLNFNSPVTGMKKAIQELKLVMKRAQHEINLHPENVDDALWTNLSFELTAGSGLNQIVIEDIQPDAASSTLEILGTLEAPVAENSVRSRIGNLFTRAVEAIQDRLPSRSNHFVSFQEDPSMAALFTAPARPVETPIFSSRSSSFFKPAVEWVSEKLDFSHKFPQVASDDPESAETDRLVEDEPKETRVAEYVL